MTKRKYAGVIFRLCEEIGWQSSLWEVANNNFPFQMWSPPLPAAEPTMMPAVATDAENPNNKVLFCSPNVQDLKFSLQVHFSKEKDDVSLYGTPKEEPGQVNTSR